MSKEQQIEDMAWDLCDIPTHPSVHSCKECGGKHCHAQYYAERAYNAGYRKQSETTAERCEQCDYKREFERLMDLPNCNDCRHRTSNACGHSPRVGETVRINCPLWEPEVLKE